MVVQILASNTGIPEMTLRILITILSTYPLGLMYRYLFIIPNKKVLSKDQVLPQHLFNFVSGLALSYFCYGNDCVHFLLATSVSWLILKLMKPSLLSTGLVFAFSFIYLLAGYWFNATENYDIDWTTSYCVMTLRLIGFAMDCYDGSNKKIKENAAPVKKESNGLAIKFSWDNVALKELPGYFETLGYTFYYAGFLVGPQFPFAIYQRFVTLESFVVNGKVVLPSSSSATWKCFLTGALYMAATQIGQAFIPPSFVISDKFVHQFSFIEKLIYIAFSARIVLTKYMGVWLMNEGGCILSGISFNGIDSNGKPKWDGLSNVDAWKYETVTSLAQVIGSFNMNTNLWSKNYIFKRLKFLGNKSLSGLGTLLFLAIWHGFAPGYFGAFILEFLDMEVEKNLRDWIFEPYLSNYYKSNHWLQYLLNLAFYLLTLVFLGVGAITFDLLTWKKIWIFWQGTYFFNHLVILVVLAIATLRPKPKKKSE